MRKRRKLALETGGVGRKCGNEEDLRSLDRRLRGEKLRPLVVESFRRNSNREPSPADLAIMERAVGLPTSAKTRAIRVCEHCGAVDQMTDDEILTL